MMDTLSHNALSAFSAPLLKPINVAQLARELGWDDTSANLYLASIVNEAHLALNLLDWAGIRDGMRVLEVGAGAGLFTAFLQAQGIAVTAIEPVAQGFGATLAARVIVSRSVSQAPNILALEARQLDPARDGLFDMIFSVNVVEHFMPLIENLDGISTVMAARGIQVHTCPNYRIPYEPHFGTALLPVIPARTPHIAKRCPQELWQSLNFITAADVRRYAKSRGLEIRFQPGLLAVALRRLLHEEAFAGRQPRWLSLLAHAAHLSGLIAPLSLLPPGLATPMTFRLQREV
ncbi:MAG: methyltransferase domain-containing protein [Reyranella sp.]|nr:methyltransferase domain-containing protein [Reyranella sp.]